MKFEKIAQTFQSIESETSRNTMTELLASLLAKLSPQEAKIVAHLALGGIYPDDYNG